MSSMDEKIKRDIKNGVPMTITHFDKNKKVIKVEEYNLENIGMLDFELGCLARAIIPKIQEYYSNEENVKKFEKEQKEREKIKNKTP